jgi:hypothetical protein
MLYTIKSCPVAVRVVREELHFGSRGSLWKTSSAKAASYTLDDFAMIRKPKSGQFRLYSRKKDPSTGKRRNLGTFATLEKAKQHEREVQYFKRH